MALSTKLEAIYLHTLPNVRVWRKFEGYERPSSTFAVASSDVVIYAGGRRRSRTTPGRSRTLSLVLTFASREDAELLESWLGLPLMYRDTKGRKLFGVIMQLQTDDMGYWTPAQNRRLTCDFTEITYTEEV